jgi:hypothetical protein
MKNTLGHVSARLSLGHRKRNSAERDTYQTSRHGYCYIRIELKLTKTGRLVNLKSRLQEVAFGLWLAGYFYASPLTAQ